MSDDFTLEVIATPEPGSYIGTITDVELTELDMKEGLTEFVRFTITIPMDEGEPFVTDAIAATRDSRGMNAYGNGRMKLTRWATALLGSPLPPFNADNVVGAQALIVLDLDASAFLKVVDIIAAPKGAKS